MSDRPIAPYDALVPSPLGPLGICLAGGRLTGLQLQPQGAAPAADRDPLAQEVARQLQAYFADPHWRFDLPLALGGTPFQQGVWEQLQAIPPGETLSYGELAALLGSGPRAIGGACRANPCPIVVPCHRVVAAHGLGGYSGARGGTWVDVKTWLLRHEGALPRP
jgi:methylated-DNA-[protein]-cysteine S-methyltransferase